MRVFIWSALAFGLLVTGAEAQTAPGWFTSGPRYERAAKCIAAILYFPQIEESRSELGILQRAIAKDGQMDNDMQVDVRTEGDTPRLRQIDMVMRHIYTATRNFQSQPNGPAVFRVACRKFEAELAH
jgi:hypothetical protein